MLISVVIPSYNHRQYVVQAIESVLDQDWPEIDLIVIDDGSKDDSARVIQSCLEKRGGFRLLVRENRGLINTLNQGMEMAMGEAVCLLASDDYLPPGSLKIRAAYLRDHPDHVAVFGDGMLVLGSNESEQRIMEEKHHQLFVVKDPLPDLIRGVHLPIHTLMARRKAFFSAGGFDSRYQFCEDLEIQLRLFLEGKVGYVDVPTYCYRRHGENQSLTNRQVARADKVRFYRKLLDEVANLEPYRKLIRNQLRRQYLLLARHLRTRTGEPASDRALLNGGWKYAWQDPRLLWHLLCLRRESEKADSEA